MSDVDDILENVHCGICGSGSAVSLFQGTDRQHLSVPENIWCGVQRCEKCGMGYLSPRVKAEKIGQFYPSSEYYTRLAPPDHASLRRRFLDDLARMHGLHRLGYPASNVELLSGFPAPILRIISAAIALINPFRFRRLLPFVPNGQLFELGFGSGYYLRQMKNLGWECWGTELDPEIVEANRALGIRAYTGISKAEIPEDYFDWVSAYHVLEHVYDPVAVLEKMFKLLKSGGQIYIGVPNIDGALPKLFRSCWYNLGVPVHPQQFSAQSLVSCLRNAGFQDIQLRHRSLALGLLGSIQFALNDLAWRSTGRKRVNMFLRDNRVCQALALPVTKCLDAMRMGDAIEVTARKR